MGGQGGRVLADSLCLAQLDLPRSMPATPEIAAHRRVLPPRKENDETVQRPRIPLSPSLPPPPARPMLIAESAIYVGHFRGVSRLGGGRRTEDRGSR